MTGLPNRLLVVVAAGSGTRLGRAEAKALIPLCGRPILAWTLEALAPLAFDRSVLAGPPDRLEEVRRLAPAAFCVVAGGQTRSASVRLAVEAVEPAEGDLVCIHDAARPLVTAAEASAVIAAAAETGAAIAATPVVDTVKRVADGRIVSTLDRTQLYAAGTPQVFRGSVLRRALATGREATDEAALCEGLGIPVAVVPVSRLAFKITKPEDLELAEAILERRLAAQRRA